MTTHSLLTPSKTRERIRTEWPTALLIVAQALAWIAVTTYAPTIGNWIAVPLLALLLTLHSSLQHEALHGHPFDNPYCNEVLVALPFGLFVPYRRFRDQHLQHHFDPALTDPYDDPESNYMDPRIWATLSAAQRLFLLFNNTLLGRMVVGPVIGLCRLYSQDMRNLRSDPKIAPAYLLHFAGLGVIAFWLTTYAAIGIWAYLLAAYAALSILKIRTFLEHRAHEKPCARTVIIRDRGLLAFLFLNNNFHLVHHAKPTLAWHKLPNAYAAQRDDYHRRNESYVYPSYRAVLRRHFCARKDPVPHPLRPHDLT